jgi:hypothetical protein
MPNAIMLIVVMLNVVAPQLHLSELNLGQQALGLNHNCKTSAVPGNNNRGGGSVQLTSSLS